MPSQYANRTHFIFILELDQILYAREDHVIIISIFIGKIFPPDIVILLAAFSSFTTIQNIPENPDLRYILYRFSENQNLIQPCVYFDLGTCAVVFILFLLAFQSDGKKRRATVTYSRSHLGN